MSSRANLALALTIGLANIYGQAAGTISGSVTAAATGQPVGGALVVAYQNLSDHTQKPTILAAQSAADGTFTISGAPAISFLVCVQADGFLSILARGHPISRSPTTPLERARLRSQSNSSRACQCGSE